VATLRLITYNILLGGERRQERIAEVLRRSAADAIALQEVRANGLLEWLAGELGMTAIYGPPSDGGEVGLGFLTRLPVVAQHNHRHPGMLRSHLEVTLRTQRASRLRLHAVHLAARFGERAKGEARRLRELDAILGDIARAPRMPHLLLGDFNSLAPGDGLEATSFFRRMAALRRARLLVRQADGWMGPAVGEAERSLDERWLEHGIDPHLQVGVPVLPWLVVPLTSLVPESRTLDRMLGRMIERWAIPRILAEGYVDCYRHLHPRAHGYTCATWVPAARVDYAFASPDVVPRLVACDVVHGRGRGGDVVRASDHFPLFVDLER
jgi:endonuclease/exonuclease/phosphatase family metal-dependent hydrolase